MSKKWHQIAQSSGLSPKAGSIHAAETGGPLLLGPHHHYRVGFARFFGMASRNRSAIAAVPPPLVQHRRGLAGRERRRGLGGTSPTPLIGSARHAQPGPILYAFRVKEMSLARARLTAPTWPRPLRFRPVVRPAREGMRVCGNGGLQGTSSAELGGHPDAAWPRGLDR